MRTSVYIAASLDGFIARSDGALDWLDEANASLPEGTDLGFDDFLKSVDTLVMGRNTFDKVCSFGLWPYGETRVIVLSHRELALPTFVPSQLVSGTAQLPASLLAQLQKDGARRVYIDGGAVIQSFLAAGLVNELNITTIPVLLGKGIRLFGAIDRDIKLEHITTQAFDCGFVQSRYRLLNEATAPA